MFDRRWSSWSRWASTFAERSWQHIATIDVPRGNFIHNRQMAFHSMYTPCSSVEQCIALAYRTIRSKLILFAIRLLNLFRRLNSITHIADYCSVICSQIFDLYEYTWLIRVICWETRVLMQVAVLFSFEIPSIVDPAKVIYAETSYEHPTMSQFSDSTITSLLFLHTY